MVRALTFDVFGTCVDWRTSMRAHCARLGEDAGIRADWERLVVRWRAAYRPAMNRVLSGDLPWTPFEALHRITLDEIAQDCGLHRASPALRDAMVAGWRRLLPWPDALGGLERLKARYTIAPLSNGNFAMLVALAKFARLPWDCVLSAEFARKYKPDPAVYAMASTYLEVPLEDMLMVAAHNYDLLAARALGMKTAFVQRAEEFGPEQTTDLDPAAPYDYVARDFLHLADLLECPA